jgi:hypothetical protein
VAATPAAQPASGLIDQVPTAILHGHSKVSDFCSIQYPGVLSTASAHLWGHIVRRANQVPEAFTVLEEHACTCTGFGVAGSGWHIKTHNLHTSLEPRFLMPAVFGNCSHLQQHSYESSVGLVCCKAQLYSELVGTQACSCRKHGSDEASCLASAVQMLDLTTLCAHQAQSQSASVQHQLSWL